MCVQCFQAYLFDFDQGDKRLHKADQLRVARMDSFELGPVLCGRA